MPSRPALPARSPAELPEIDEIRGVDSGATLKLLLDRDLVRVLGKKEEPGRPLLYGTTRQFLEFFSLNDLRELPTLRDHLRTPRAASTQPTDDWNARTQTEDCRRTAGPIRSARRSTSFVPRGDATATSQRTLPRKGSTDARRGPCPTIRVSPKGRITPA